MARVRSPLVVALIVALVACACTPPPLPPLAPSHPASPAAAEAPLPSAGATAPATRDDAADPHAGHAH